MKRLLLVMVVLVPIVGACTGGGVDPLPAPPTTQPRTPTTTAPDFTGVVLRDVPGRTTTTVAVTPGRATINGVVGGPDGPVPGALVRAERLVGDAVGRIDVATAADGTFALTGVKGGRWRVRAFRPSDLALVKPEIFYLEDGATQTLTLRVERYAGIDVSSAFAPDPPVVGDPANLVVQVTLQSVDGDGVVRGRPVPGVRVELFGAGDWRVESTNIQPTDSSGRALWRVRCESPGNQPLSVLVGDSESFPLTLPACIAAPPSTTSTSSSTSSTTSTTRPPSTTSTTRSSTTTSSTTPRP
ncbi:MAG: hypothetical protein KY443_06420 [Actinobacteria bacterium]|nr:hypothetical protein [Actinomycetota bacterium]